MTIRIDHKDLMVLAFFEAISILSAEHELSYVQTIGRLLKQAQESLSNYSQDDLQRTIGFVSQPFIDAVPPQKVEPQMPEVLSQGGGVVQTEASDIGEIASINALLSEGIRMAMIAGGRNPVFNAAACRTMVDVLNSNGIRRIEGLIFAACFEKLRPGQLKLINEFMAQWEISQIQSAIAANGGEG